MTVTKAVTTVARHLRQFQKVQVLRSFYADGNPSFRQPGKPPTLRQLITHPSGLSYDIWDADILRYTPRIPNCPQASAR